MVVLGQMMQSYKPPISTDRGIAPEHAVNVCFDYSTLSRELLERSENVIFDLLIDTLT